MDIKTLLPKSHVIFNLAGAGRCEIVRSLASPLVADGVITDLDAFLADIERRENEITTQAENGVAFPHARSHAVRRLALTVGIVGTAGVDFGGPETPPCRVVFLIAVPSFAPTAHLPLLQSLANVVHDPKRIDKLLASRTDVQVIRALTSTKR